MNPYQTFVSDCARSIREGRRLPLGGLSNAARPKIPADAPRVLFFAPHPDDETIIGGLALRLLRQARWKVINVAVTLGSKPDRKLERLAELKAACQYLGFGLHPSAPRGLEEVKPSTRSSQPQLWSQMVGVILKILKEHRPKV